ncbi:Zn-dependent exopeptidase [Auriculariales sp. MPI-PUGE-AT-0066]|nr:Zn-dependent exopeptidase [Auriculariales sp. MPI-PUGE-AT-0066]
MKSIIAPALLCAASTAVAQYAAQQPLYNVQSMTAAQRESLMLDLWSEMDVVDLMHLTGHGDGLDEKRLVDVFGESAPRWMTEGDKLRLKRLGTAFMDITDHEDLGRVNAMRPSQLHSAPVELSNDDTVKKTIEKLFEPLDDSHLRADIKELTAFYNRNYKSDNGRKSSDWVFDHVSSIVSKSTLKTSVTKFAHSFAQSSVVARLEDPLDDTKDKPVIIIGGHADSLNYLLPWYRAPGADDDGSGTVTVFQILRSLVEQNFTPPRGLALEFHWYAAEEGGLLGSQDIAASYEKAGRKVKGMLQMDMVAFLRPGTPEIIGFFKDVVDKSLTKFGTKLVDRYIPLPWNMTGCGTSCGSDHMSWTKAGYPAIFATEGLFEDGPRTIHTHKDDLNQEGYSFSHMLHFVKLGLAFVVELSVA